MVESLPTSTRLWVQINHGATEFLGCLNQNDWPVFVGGKRSGASREICEICLGAGAAAG